ncbi:MAG: CHAT domain-containing protein, partial [Desulfobacterales bacterium]
MPFETLKDQDGKYLVETHDISYAQSVSVLNLLKERMYEKNKKPMLAFGGAIYDNITYPSDKILNENQLLMLENKMLSSFQEKR